MVQHKYIIKDGVIYGDQNFSLPSDLNYGRHFVEICLGFGDKIAVVWSFYDKRHEFYALCCAVLFVVMIRLLPKIDESLGEKISYNLLSQRIINTAASLSQLGVKQGEVVGICSQNRIEFLITTFAALLIGAVVTFINCAYSEDEFVHTTKISKPKYIFFSPRTYTSYYETLRKQNFVSKFFVFGKTTENNVTCFSELLRCNVNRDSFKPTSVNDGTQTAIIVYSSGTTGLPKGAKWTHLGLIIASLQPVPTNRDLICLSVAPWTNTVGFILTTDLMTSGRTIVSLERFNEKVFLNTIQKHQIGYLITVPPIIVMMTKSLIIKDFDVRSVEIIYTGGAPIEASTIVDVTKRFKNLKLVLQGYGMTEATGALSTETEDVNRQGSVGRIMPGLMIKVVDVDTRKVLGPNKEGEVCMKGPVLFGGYVGKPRADDYDEEGFYKTGDIAYYDDDGFIFIVDRLKELIKYKAWQVSPSELEAALLQHPSVKDCGVIGIPDSLAGELPAAFVVRQPGDQLTEKELVDFVDSKVSPWKQLRGGVRFVEEIPKNGSGKILRRVLRDSIKKTMSKL